MQSEIFTDLNVAAGSRSKATWRSPWKLSVSLSRCYIV